MTRHDSGSIGSRAASGVLWASAATLGAKAASLVAVAVLARLLAPQDFGVFAFALGCLIYLDTLSDLGTGMALIYWRDRRADAAQVTFVTSVAVGLLLFGLTIGLAPAVAGFFHSPSGIPILRALAWSFPIRALGVTHDALCQKELGFQKRFVPEVALTSVKAVVAIGLALAGFGVWSLVYGQLAGFATWSLLLWVMVPWRPAWHWPADLLRPMLRYGRAIVAVNVLAAITNHADLIAVGRVLGTAVLGFYQIAYRIPDVVLTVLVRIPGKVVFPAFAAVYGRGGTLSEAYTVTLRYVALAAVPVCAAVAVLARPLILVAFGEPWRGSIPILQALALYTCLRALGNHAGDVMKATGRADLLAILAVGKAALLVVVLIDAAPHGPTAVALAMASVAGLSMAVDVVVVSHLTGLALRAIAAAVLPALAIAAVVTAALMGWRVVWARMSPFPELVGSLAVGLFAFLIAARVVTPQAWSAGVESVRDALRARALQVERHAFQPDA